MNILLRSALGFSTLFLPGLLLGADNALSAPASVAGPISAPLPVLYSTNLHKFTFVKQKGEANSRWAYATITEVSRDGVILQKWETSKDPDWSIWQSPTVIAFDQFIPDDQQFIKDWTAQHPSGSTAAAPIAVVTGAQGIACFFPDYSFLVDTSGVLKGKTITAIASSDEHFLALCSDGTLAAWGQNVYGQLGNGQHGVDTLSLVPVLVDMADALKGKTIASIGAFENGSYALCSDGSLYTWGLPPLNFLLKKSDVPRFLQDKPALFDPVALKGKIVTAVSTDYRAGQFSVLCSDGSLFNWESVKKGGHGISVAVQLNNLGVLKGKKVTLIGDGNKALCSDGTLARWDPVLVRHGFSVDLKEDPVDIPDQTSVLKGKTIVAFLELNRVLCSDGTVAELGEEDVGHGIDHKNLYPQLVKMDVPEGKKLTAIAGSFFLYSDESLGVRPPPSSQFQALYHKETDFVHALQGQPILAIAPNMVLFKEPAAPAVNSK